MKITKIIAVIYSAIALVSNAAPAQRPNFIFIYTDDQQYDGAGYTGNDVIITPVIDKLAAQGLRFNNAHVVFALCSPSRAALLTGRYGSANGVLELGGKLNEGEVTVAERLRSSGYATGMVGKWHLSGKPKELGFDFQVYFDANGTYYGRKIYDMGKVVRPKKHCDLYCANRAVDFLKKQAASEEPFFLFYNSQTPHMNGKLVWDAQKKTKKRYDVNKMPVPANHLDDLSDKPKYLKTVRNRTKAFDYGYPSIAAIQSHTRDYYSVISELDGFIGRIVNAVDELGLRQNTYVFYMSDNGWMLGDHGFTSKVLPYQPSTHVPCFILGPDIQSGETDSIISNIDMMSTLLELAHIQEPANLHGTSLVPILRNTQANVRDVFIYEGLGTFGGGQPNLTAISKKFKLIVTYKDGSLRDEIFREMYQSVVDPEEMNNIASLDEYEEVREKLFQNIEQHKAKVLGIAH